MDNGTRTVTLNKFQSVVERLMTDEEIKEKCTEMGVETKVYAFILNVFNSARNRIDEYDSTEDSLSAGEGRLSLGYSHENVREDLAEVMGVSEDDAYGPEVARVYDAFFEE